MVCPYFSREEDLAVTCQAPKICASIRCRVAFRSKEAKRNWVGRHCETFEYWKCPFCEMIDEAEEE